MNEIYISGQASVHKANLPKYESAVYQHEFFIIIPTHSTQYQVTCIFHSAFINNWARIISPFSHSLRFAYSKSHYFFPIIILILCVLSKNVYSLDFRQYQGFDWWIIKTWIYIKASVNGTRAVWEREKNKFIRHCFLLIIFILAVVIIQCSQTHTQIFFCFQW